ncbi:M56 family metallopeptidase [Thalassotalea agarivorans]|uniref:Protein TonB n=1 Tax=Thalassotalea agarivorans TaxID=349064 RepID=A0A1I0HQC0_THASX|nr:M56 family metallopeptidase [Thalassotalea agarivorans]SET85964.1 TonB family C-terminal domain-containing protein [Thalassotalea agarivorans]
MLNEVLNSPVLYSLAVSLLHFLWQGLLIAAVLRIYLLITPVNRSKARYNAACSAMLMCLIAPIVTFALVFEPQLASVVEQHYVSFQIVSNETTILGVRSNQYLPYLSVGWFASVFILTVKLALDLKAVNQLPKDSFTPKDPELLATFLRLCDQIGLSKVPAFLLSKKATVPMALGWLKPTVLIPTSMLTGLTPAQLEMLILHELAHVKRHDYIVNFVQTLVEILLFFHPAVGWISYQIRNERECCTDDLAVSCCGKPLDYARTLADTASVCLADNDNQTRSLAIAASGGELKKRVVRLVHPQHYSAQSRVAKRLALFTSALTITLTALLVAAEDKKMIPSLAAKTDNLLEIRFSQLNFETMTSFKNGTLDKVATNLIGMLPLYQAPVPFARTDEDNILLIKSAAEARRIELQRLRQEQLEQNKQRQMRKKIVRLPMPVAPQLQQAILLKQKQPQYPYLAQRRGIEMNVKVDFTIDEMGQIRNIQIEDKPKVRYFKSSIKKALKKWQFEPATENGKAIESQMSKVFAFNLA